MKSLEPLNEIDQEIRFLKAQTRRLSGQDKARYCPHCGALKTRNTILWCIVVITLAGLTRLLFS